MKKILFCVLVYAFTVDLHAQTSAPLLALTDKSSDDGYEYEKYFYNQDLQLKEIQILYSDGVQAKETIQYDSQKNAVKLDGFQVLDGQWKQTYYINYTYDANGNKISRANYNNFGGPDFELGGIYDYQYDNNRRSGWQLTMMGKVVEQGQLLYNNDGKLIEEVAQDNWATGQMENSWKVVYNYNQDGSLGNTSQYFWSGSSWDLFSTDMFYYNTEGNCIKWEHLTDDVVTNRYEYDYNTDYQRNQLLLPLSPEDEADPFRWVEYKNQMVRSHWHTQNDNGELIYVCDFLYNYTPLQELATSDVKGGNAGFLVYPNPAAEQITILSEGAPVQNITVTDMSGKVVMRVQKPASTKVQLNVSQLSPGAYVVQGNASGRIISKKILVK